MTADQYGWKKLDDELPPNNSTILIWNIEANDVQFAEFKMYSARRYEFTQGSSVLSIHSVTHWQEQPPMPKEFEA